MRRGEQLGHDEINALLGADGMREVYLPEDPRRRVRVMRKSRRRRLRAGLLATAFLSVACSAAPPEPADTVLHGGNIVTLDPELPVAAAVAVRDGRIVAVGSDAEVLRFSGPETAAIDLGGRSVVPGLADNHFHGVGGGPGVDLSAARTLQQVLEAIATRVAAAAPDDIIVTNSDWHEGQLAEQRLPLRGDLDTAAPDHPVVVVRGGHEYVLNSAALRFWDIDESTPEPEGGRIGRYADGRLNGELVDRAKSLARVREGRGDGGRGGSGGRGDPGAVSGSGNGAERALRALADSHARLNAVGLTSVRYAGASPALYEQLRELQRRGELTIRANLLFRVPADPERVADTLSAWSVGPDDGDDWVRVGGIKLGVDGGFEGGWMTAPYEEPWGEGGTFYGLQTAPRDAYIGTVAELNRHGWRVATHAVGDAAIDLVLEAYGAADAERPIAGRRWVIEHGFVPRPDQFGRMRELELLVAAQDHLYVAAPSLVNYWGRQRAEWVTPVRAYLDAGIRVSSGTDAPVIPYNPWWTLYHFSTRDTISAGVTGADQAVGREEALRLATVENAYLTFEEESKGTLEVGKLADMLVLDDDFLSVADEVIEDMRVLLTIVGGRIVYRAPDW